MAKLINLLALCITLSFQSFSQNVSKPAGTHYDELKWFEAGLGIGGSGVGSTYGFVIAKSKRKAFAIDYSQTITISKDNSIPWTDSWSISALVGKIQPTKTSSLYYLAGLSFLGAERTNEDTWEVENTFGIGVKLRAGGLIGKYGGINMGVYANLNTTYVHGGFTLGIVIGKFCDD